MLLCTYVSLVLLPLQVLSDVKAVFTLTNFAVDAGKSVSDFFPGGCTDAEITLTPQITTSKNMFVQQPPLVYYTGTCQIQKIPIPGTVTFRIPTPGDVYVISSSIQITARGQTIQDYTVLLTESASTWDDTWPSTITGTGSSNPNLKVSSSFNRNCDPDNLYGLNCNELCKATTTDNDQSCYTCDAEGRRQCCNQPNVNQQFCTYTNHPPTTSTASASPEPCSEEVHYVKGKEDLYFWIMIGLAMVSGFLLILLLVCLLLLCRKNKKRATIAPVYIQPAVTKSQEYIVPRESRPSVTERREPQPYPERRDLPPYATVNRNPSPKRTVAPTVPVQRGSYQLEYDLDDESLRDEWMEPMPRRVAKV